MSRENPGILSNLLEESLFVEKLIRYAHEKVMHMRVANSMAVLREIWWISKMRSLVKKVIRNCNVGKVFSAKPFGNQETAALPLFRTTMSLELHDILTSKLAEIKAISPVIL